ncbi:MAG: ABC transporter ATP-binding protein, partial [Dehalococcoidia bacterium]|nr:ABC transporter ATP-binding protein [Dehalococcoidia bacterium]
TDLRRPAANPIAVAADSLCFAYPNGAPILERFAWTARQGDSWAIVGPSGCGKTTLLYLLAGLRRPTAGAITVFGEPVTGPRPTTGLILQDLGLLPWATARQNIELGLKLRGTPAAQRRRLTDVWLSLLDIAPHADRYPAQLSGGQRQRVAIARTLIMDPQLLLMDEPFSALDALTRESLQDEIIRLRQRHPVTTILVTHSIEEAVFLGDHILIFGRPPLRGGIVVDNPDAGRLEFRRERAFYDRVLEVRRLVEEMRP